jgi:hypothetical protein
MMVAVIPALIPALISTMVSTMVSTFIMSATTIMATAHGDQYTPAGGEQGDDGQHQE